MSVYSTTYDPEKRGADERGQYWSITRGRYGYHPILAVKPGDIIRTSSGLRRVTWAKGGTDHRSMSGPFPMVWLIFAPSLYPEGLSWLGRLRYRVRIWLAERRGPIPVR